MLIVEMGHLIGIGGNNTYFFTLKSKAKRILVQHLEKLRKIKKKDP